MSNRLRISEGIRAYNAKAKKDGRPKMSLAKLAPHVFPEGEGIVTKTAVNYLSMWNTSCDPQPGVPLVKPEPKHIGLIAEALGMTMDELVEK